MKKQQQQQKSALDQNEKTYSCWVSTVLSMWPLRNSQTVSNTLMTSNVFSMSDCYNYFVNG